MTFKDELNGYIDQIAAQEKRDESYWNEIIPNDQAVEIANKLFSEAMESLKDSMKRRAVYKEKELLSKKTLFFKESYKEYYNYIIHMRWNDASVEIGSEENNIDYKKNFKDTLRDRYIIQKEWGKLISRNVGSITKVLDLLKEKLQEEGFTVSGTYYFFVDGCRNEERNWCVYKTHSDWKIRCILVVPCSEDGEKLL